MLLRAKFIESLAKLLKVPQFSEAPKEPPLLRIIVINVSGARRWVTVEPTAAGEWQEPGTHCQLTTSTEHRESTLSVYIHEDGVCFSDDYSEFYCLDYDYDYGSRAGDYEPAA